MSEIDLPSLAPDLLQVIGLSLPTIAIFIALGGGKERQEDLEVSAFLIALASLLLVVLAAGFNVAYLALYRADWMLYVAIGLYFASLVSLAVSTCCMLVARIGRS